MVEVDYILVKGLTLAVRAKMSAAAGQADLLNCAAAAQTLLPFPAVNFQ